METSLNYISMQLNTQEGVREKCNFWNNNHGSAYTLHTLKSTVMLIYLHLTGTKQNSVVNSWRNSINTVVTVYGNWTCPPFRVGNRTEFWQNQSVWYIISLIILFENVGVESHSLKTTDVILSYVRWNWLCSTTGCIPHTSKHKLWKLCDLVQ